MNNVGYPPYPPGCQTLSRGPNLAITAWVVFAIGSLIGLSVWGQYSSGETGPLFALDIAAGAVSCALLPVTLRRPVTGALATIVLAALSPAATPAAAFGLLRVAQRQRFAVAVSVAVAGFAAHASRDLWRPITGLPIGWWLVLTVVGNAALVGWGALSQAHWALVGSLRDRAGRAEAEQGRRVAEARAAERTRIAREMHDVLAHRLSLLSTYAGALEYRPDAPPELVSRAASVVRAGAHDALEELREVIAVLRDDDADEAERPQPVLADLPALIEESRGTGTDVCLTNRIGAAVAPPPVTGRTAYRIVREALTNARKHAAGQPVRVDLSGAPGSRLTIDIQNPLPAAPAEPLVPGSGTGLIGLTERVRLVGGRLDHELSTGRFRLRAELPWPE